ncbi:MAG: transcription antitermination protein NusB [Alphaproteobacteria bacterium]|nr:transcription antitermination protein NusB [Alphaproteobacteria bacterium]
MAFGVCRHRGELDAMVGAVSKRPVSRMDRPVRVALRIGLFERWMSRTPVHAATDQAVRLCKKLGAAHASGLRERGDAPRQARRGPAGLRQPP